MLILSIICVIIMKFLVVILVAGPILHVHVQSTVDNQVQ